MNLKRFENDIILRKFLKHIYILHFLYNNVMQHTFGSKGLLILKKNYK